MTAAARPGQRGLALVSVLWGVAILSLIAAAMLSASVTTAHIDRNVWNAVRAGAVGDAAISRAILMLQDERKPARVDGTPTAFAFDGLAVRLQLQDEAGKINLNYADKDLLQGLFESAGASREQAGALADRIVARRLPPDATTGAPAPLAFRAVDELASIPGMSPALLARVAPALTVFGNNASVDRDVAPREVLRALPDLDAQKIATLLEARDEAQRAIAAANATAAARAAPRSIFTVTAEVRGSGARALRVAVVQFTGDPARPYWILAWK